VPEPPGNLWELLDDRQRRAIRAAAEVRRFPAGTALIREGDHAAWVLILTSGRVKVVSATPGGHDAVLAVRGPGDILGEMAAMDSNPRSASAIAVEPVTALRLPADAFARLLRDHPGIAAVLLKIITARLRYANTRRAEFGDSTAAERIAALLAELAARYGTPVSDGTLISLRINQSDLASLAATSREAVTRTLRAMRSAGLISTGRRRLVIRDLATLRRQAGAAWPTNPS
jgi:CRP/FNR family transcriptional regulator, cyclic AMP receptor protein